MKHTELKHLLLLFLTAMIWGAAFVAQSAGMDYVGPFTFLSARSFLGGIFLLPCIRFLDNRNTPDNVSYKTAHHINSRKQLLISGCCAGLVLMLASSLQQIGLQHNRRESRISHCDVCHYCPVFGHFSIASKAGKTDLDMCSFRGMRHGIAMPKRFCTASAWRCAGASVRTGIFYPHFNPGLFHSKDRPSTSFLHSIFRLWYPICHTDAAVGTSNYTCTTCRMAANRLCRHSFQRRRLYATGDCSEKMRSNAGFTRHVSGVCFQRSIRLDYPSSVAQSSGGYRLHSYVRCHRTGKSAW